MRRFEATWGLARGIIGGLVMELDASTARPVDTGPLVAFFFTIYKALVQNLSNLR